MRAAPNWAKDGRGEEEFRVKEADVDWFRPLWRRVAVTAFIAAWCAWEWYGGEQLWQLLTTAALVYAVWSFFITIRGERG